MVRGRKAEAAAEKPKRGRPKKPARADMKPLPPIVSLGVPSEETSEQAGQKPFGRPSEYKQEYAIVASGMASMGATDFELAQAIGVNTSTIWYWRSRHKDFSDALKKGKEEFDDRVERSLAQRAVGYSYHSEKVFCSEGIVTIVPIVEHVPPDVGACKHWLANRRPKEWREKQEVELTGSEAFLAMWKAISAGAVPKSGNS